MEKKFWILDLSAEKVKDEDEIWIWSIGEDGERAVLRVKVEGQRFYVVPKADPLEAARKISNISGVISAQVVEKRLFGEKVSAVEVLCKPSKIEDVSKAVKDLGTSYEDDLRLSVRFILDNDIKPASWYKCFVEQDGKGGNGVNCTYRLIRMEKTEELAAPKLRVVGLDFLYEPKIGTPIPERDPVVAISIARDDGVKRQFTGEEKSIIKAFIEEVEGYNPDVIVGYRLNTSHWPYLLIRAKKLGIKLEVGRLKTEPHQSVYGHFSIAGRINFDLKDYAREITELERGTLEELARFLGLPQPKLQLDEFLYPKYWKEDREKVLEYSMWRASASLSIFQTISDHIFTMSSITGVPPDYVFSAAAGYRLENYLMEAAVRIGELIPKPVERALPTYPGGKVLTPEKGIHENVAVIDFKAMYPSIMLKYNISPDTVKRAPCPKGFLFIEEAGTCIAQDRKGFFTEVLERAVKEREAVRDIMKKYPKDSREYRFLDAMQRTLKVLANAMYGYMGWTGARWYLREGAETVTALGRRTITEAIEKAKELGLKVVYGDTDSLFVKYDKEKVDRLLSWIERELGLEAKLEKIYKKVIFTEAKKKYAGLTIDNVLDLVGLEAVRGDWCKFAKDTQRVIADLLLRGASKDRVISVFRERITELRNKNVDLLDLVIWKQLAKRIDEYEVSAPHTVVAKELISEGWKVTKGDYIGFVVVKGKGPIHARSKHYSKVDIDEVDIDYYIEKQIVPVCARILNVIGLKEDSLLKIAKTAGMGLESFF